MPVLDLGKLLSGPRKKKKPTPNMLAVFEKLRTVVDASIACGQVTKDEAVTVLQNCAEAVERDLNSDRFMEAIAKEKEKEAEQNPLLIN